MTGRERALFWLAFHAWDLSAWALRRLPVAARALAITRMQIATLPTCPHRAGATTR